MNGAVVWRLWSLAKAKGNSNGFVLALTICTDIAHG
jgi:hypothetical protein